METATKISWGKRRTATRESILCLLLRGELSAGERINELVLAQQLGVSRTPVREALIGLEEEGFFHRSRKGLIVPPLTVQGAMEIYPILGSLEASAMRQSGLGIQATVDELKAICELMCVASKEPEKLLSLHSSFHLTLLGYCPNLQLVALIERLDKQALRYEYAYIENVGERAKTTEPGEGIIWCLERGELERAANLLQMSWLGRLDAIVRWLQKSRTRNGRMCVTESGMKQGAA